jgi:para-nitrobenzyl esterase
MPGSTMASCLCIDGYVLKDAPGMIFDRGKEAKVPLIIGVNKDEGTLFCMSSRKKSLKTLEFLISLIMPEMKDEIFKFYNIDGEDSAERGLPELVGDFFVAGCRSTAKAHSRAGNPVYKYVFKRELPWARRMGLGAFHGFEISYVFGTNPGRLKGYRQADRDLSRQMMGYWTRFAKNGDPNGKDEYLWPLYSEKDGLCIVFDKSLSTCDFYRKKYCDFIDVLNKIRFEKIEFMLLNLR